MNKPLIDCDTATAEETAAAVVKYIEEHGWQQRDSGGGNGPVCLIGGMAAVCGQNPRLAYTYLDEDAPPALLRLADALRYQGVEVTVGTYQSGSLAGRRYISSLSVYQFNDRLDQTVDSVLAPLRRIANLEVAGA